MLQQVSYEEIPESQLLPEDAYVFTVTEPEWVYSGGTIPKLMAKCKLTVEEPDHSKKMVRTLNLCIGTDDDPEADEIDSWKKIGGRRFKQFLYAVYGEGAQLTGDPVTDFAGTDGYTLGSIVTQKTDTREDSQYKGQANNEFTRFFTPGSQGAPVPGEGIPGGKRAGAPKRTAAPTPRSAAPARAAAPAGRAAAPSRTAPSPRPSAVRPAATGNGHAPAQPDDGEVDNPEAAAVADAPAPRPAPPPRRPAPSR